jgi:hypothetical protein
MRKQLFVLALASTALLANAALAVADGPHNSVVGFVQP